jgi:hypothetical protein
MKLWVHSKEHSEGKFLVVRRDGSVPAWPHFVLGARDPAAPATLRAYADEHERLGADPEYVASVRKLAEEFEAYRAREGDGDPEAPPHRTDDADVIHVMSGGDGAVYLWQSTNAKKGSRR